VSPYASAPGISGTSAINRPSTSVSTSMRMGERYSIALDVQDGFLASNRWIVCRTVSTCTRYQR
jgi:phosphoribosylformimino-5-aminoimidazole carboxamide ribonucleotide (ProFAR) isomerase